MGEKLDYVATDDGRPVVTVITDDEGPRLVIDGCLCCDSWYILLAETVADGAPEGNTMPLGMGHSDIVEVAHDACFWGYILGLRVQTGKDNLAYLREMEEGEETELLLTGAKCSVCRKPQFDTPSGVSCENGHGGADALPVEVEGE